MTKGAGGAGGAPGEAGAAGGRDIVGSAGDGSSGGGKSNFAGEAGEAGESGATGADRPNAGGASDEGGAAGQPNSVEYVPLPEGSREVADVVNLVDPAAAQQLDTFMSTLNGGLLDLGLNRFLERYEEVYDFVFFLTDHPLPQSNVIGQFTPVTRPPQRGTGAVAINVDGYKTNGRVKGAIGIQYLAGQFGPFVHEILHYWANYLDPKFGFDSGHWGFAGLHGQLGGFDPATLKCETPKGAQPGSCSALTNGKTAYSVARFAPNANGAAIPYAPFELYLMGLLPLAEVPPQIQILSGASIRSGSYDQTTGTQIVEATTLSSVAVADIVARHGQVQLLSSDSRAFRAAFVVLSATPVSEQVLAEVSSWSAIVGNRQADANLKSFEFVTGNRAILDTRLGARRPANAPPPSIRVAPDCDLLHASCGSGMSCYMFGQRSICDFAGPMKRGEPCTKNNDCVAQHECRLSSTQKYVCQPQCDPSDPKSPIACAALCPDRILLSVADGKVLIGVCPAG